MGNVSPVIWLGSTGHCLLCPYKWGLSLLPDRRGQGPLSHSYPGQFPPGIRPSVCLLLPHCLGLGQVPALWLETWTLLPGHPSPWPVLSPAATASRSTAGLCDSRQVSDLLWAHEMVDEVMPGLVPWGGLALHLTSPPRGPLAQLPSGRPGTADLERRVAWVSLTPGPSPSQAGGETAATLLLQATFQDSRLQGHASKGQVVRPGGGSLPTRVAGCLSQASSATWWPQTLRHLGPAAGHSSGPVGGAWLRSLATLRTQQS